VSNVAAVVVVVAVAVAVAVVDAFIGVSFHVCFVGGCDSGVLI
jgi:hypothetical protein